MNNFTILRSELKKLNINISDEQIEQFHLYFDLLIEWNSKMNLTAISDFDGVIYKHFLDSLSLMKFVNINDKSILDVGTGAGFPGIPLAIMNPKSSFYLLDSLNKRIVFLNEVISSLGLENVYTFHGRAEDYAFDKKFRESFDIVTSRAVANLSTLSEYCIPFSKVDGYFIPFKTDHCDEEIKTAIPAIKELGSAIEKVEDYSLNYEDIINRLIFIKKINHTKKKYPRKAGVPSKLPLFMECNNG